MTTTQEPVRARPAFRAARWLLRILLTLTALVMISQPISIGQYLQGRYDLLAVHQTVADGAVLTCFLSLCASIFYAVVGGRVWVPIVVLALSAAVELQLTMGYAHELGIHVPLGVGIVAATIGMAWWGWSRSSAQARRPRRSVRTEVL